MATFLHSAISKLCNLCHISWAKHNEKRWRKDDVYPYVLMVKDYNDTIYSNIDCSGEELMVKSEMWEGNNWASQYTNIYKSPHYDNLFFSFFDN